MIKIKKILKYIYKGFGYSFLFTICFVMITTFLITYFFSPIKTAVISINASGEAHLEFVLILLFFPFFIYSIFSALREMKKEREKLKT